MHTLITVRQVSEIEDLILSVVISCMSPLRMRSHICRLNSGQTSFRDCRLHLQCGYILHFTSENESMLA